MVIVAMECSTDHLWKSPHPKKASGGLAGKQTTPPYMKISRLNSFRIFL
jgi:hypothetical protein